MDWISSLQKLWMVSTLYRVSCRYWRFERKIDGHLVLD